MTTPTIELIKQLRQATGAGIMDCRQALEQSGADYDNALALLRAKGQETAARRADRETPHGVVELYAHGSGRVGVMVEINTETDFAGRSALVRAFAHEIALQVAAAEPLYVQEGDIPAAVIEEETLKASAKARAEGKPEALVPRIAAGYLRKYQDEHVLLRQVSIRDDKITVSQMLNQAIAGTGEKIVIRRFSRWELGETNP